MWLTMVLVLSTTLPGRSTSATAIERSIAPSAAATVTLITGDRVTVTSEGGTVLDRGEGRDHVTFLAQRTGGDLYVIPSDALPLVRDGRLDRRLFNVTLLRESVYQARSDLPLIVTTSDAAARGVPPAAATTGVETFAALPAVNGVAVEVDKAQAGAYWDNLTDPGGDGPSTMVAGVSKVWLDGVRQLLLDESVLQVGAPAAWGLGLDGSGTTVAVLDSGIDASHPDLAGRITSQMNFTGGFEDDRDLVGHGTHVASIIAGSGVASSGQYRGVAHGAQLLDGKVCVQRGCLESWILAGMQWAAEQGADVVNMSLGAPDTPEVDVVEQAVNTLTDQFGVLFVIAAGNDGLGGDHTVNSPANADSALAVGSVDKGDELAVSSSRGPRLDGALKPDLTAPGVEIVAARSADGFLGEPGEAYMPLSGTSMATPHVAGAAAILAQQHPDWSPDQLKSALMNSAAPRAALGPYAQGAGRLDVARAIDQTVTTLPASISFQRPLWPHDDNQPETRPVTYQNNGDTDITLDLTVTALRPDGAPAPADLFTVGGPTVTVPAGGTAEVSITADTSLAGAGFFGGYLTASSEQTVVNTAFAVELEAETYDVTLVHTDRSGAPTSNYSTVLFRVGEPEVVNVFGPDTVSVRVAAGEYALMSFVNDFAGEQVLTTLLAQPSLLVDQRMTLAVDARQGRPISVSVPKRDAAPALAVVSADRIAVGGATALADSFDVLFSAQLGPDQMVDGFTSTVRGDWARPGPDGEFANTPYSYHGAWFTDGRMVTGFQRDVRRRDLATVRADHAAHVPESEGAKSTFGFLPGVTTIAWGIGFPATLPFTRTEYHNTDSGVEWRKIFEERLPSQFPGFPPQRLSSMTSGFTLYEAGRLHREDWNFAVFGPSLLDGVVNDQQLAAHRVSRIGDRLLIVPSLYTDRAGHIVSASGSGTLRVFHNGELIAEQPSFAGLVEVPPEAADYRVEIEGTRDPRLPLTTRTSLAWTFESGHAEVPEPLPVSVVRFSPPLDRHNTAPAGRRYRIPVEVQPQPDAEVGDVETLTVEASFDDGQTWHEAPVVRGQRVEVKHPDADANVSLRATVTYTNGNTTEQTIIRAYQTKSRFWRMTRLPWNFVAAS